VIRVAIETATARGSVAVGRYDRPLAEVSVGIQRRHAETMLPALDSALSLAGVGRDAIEAAVVGAGPGSFTGVRVAGATAKGLATGLGVPLIAYSSLLTLAAGAAADGPVCALFDARRGEVYAGCWRIGTASIEKRLAPRVGPVESVVAALRDADADDATATLFVGDGAARYRTRLEEAGMRVATRPSYPRASTLLWLAHHHDALGRVVTTAWEPDYVRASSAERGVAG
jgi:tRNA threonylcarbamoyladenosine biosynthesis protein TsaB